MFYDYLAFFPPSRLAIPRTLRGRVADTTRSSPYAAFNNACTFGQGSGVRFLKGAQSASDMRSKSAALTDGRARMRAHQSAMAGYRSHSAPSFSSSSRSMYGMTAHSALEKPSPARY